MERKSFYFSFLVLLLALTSSSILNTSYGQGLGQDQALPVTIGDKRVAVEAIIKPSFLPITDSSSPTLVIRAHEESSDITIPGIDYRIVVELRNETLLDQRFRAADGAIVANLIPDKTIDGWEVNGKVKPTDAVEVRQSMPVQLKSRILTTGGLYHIAATIEKGSPGIMQQIDQKFDLYVSVGSTQTFNAQTQEGKKEFVLKSYYDEVGNFSYVNKTISFEMPFNWNPAFVSNVPVLHVETQFPKALKEMQANGYHGTLNGRDLHFTEVVIDDYSSEQNRIVHLIAPNTLLGRLAETTQGIEVAAFTLEPSDKPKFPLDLTSLPAEKFVFEIAWDPDLIETGTPTTFVMNMQDAKSGGLVRGASFDFVITQNGSEAHREHLSSNIGTYTTQYTFSKPGTITLAADNINGQGESAKIDVIVLQGSGNNTEQNQQQAPQSGCLIATAAFGSELTPEVVYLRYFRDHYILSTASGSAFMNTFNTIYYSFSPQVADYEREQPWLQVMVKIALYPLFGALMAAEGVFSSVEGEAGSILAGAAASSLIGAVYLWPVGFAASGRIGIKLLSIIVGVSAALLTVTLMASPELLPLSTAVFVMSIAAASAIGIAKSLKCMARSNSGKLKGDQNGFLS